MYKLFWTCLIVVGLVACGDDPSAQTTSVGTSAEAPITVEVPVTVEVTRIVEVERVVTATPLPSPEPSATPEFDPINYLGTAGVDPDELPPGEGGLSIILVGPTSEFSDSLYPVVVRNNTGGVAAGISISATIRDSSGSVMGTGQSVSMSPYYVPPEGIAFGLVSLGDTPATSGNIEYLVTASDGTFVITQDLEIIEHNNLGDKIAGLLVNNSNSALGLIGIDVLCFNSELLPTSMHDSFTAQDRVEAGNEVAFQVDLFQEPDCGRYLIASNGLKIE